MRLGQPLSSCQIAQIKRALEDMKREINLPPDQYLETQLKKYPQEFENNPLKQKLLKEKSELQSLLVAKVIQTQKMVEPFVMQMWKSKDEELTAKLGDPHPLIRCFAAQILALRQAHVEKELIPLLKDPYVQVRNAAHQALVRLGRGTDFGPSSKASKAEIKQAIARWTEWLAMQDPIAPSLNSQNRNSDLEPFQLIEKKKSTGKSPP
jgi:hypothetical protein